MNLESFIEDRTSHSAHGLDLKMKEFIGFSGGFFIECGAYDGVYQSNTKIYEDLAGWEGILIEASPNMAESCKKNRRSKVYNCCLVSEDFPFEKNHGDFSGGLMSSVEGKRTNSNERIEVVARTLSSILEENKVKNVDFFSLDVEGYELEVLKGLDFNRWKPSYILIEIMKFNELEVNGYMKAYGYELIRNMTNFNHFDNPTWDGTHNDFLFSSIKK